MTSHTIIIGAGLTGLTAAFKLKQAGKSFTVLEESDRVGGVIRSVQEEGFLYEGGPNSGTLGNEEVVRLFDELDGKCRMQLASSLVKRRYVLKDGKWNALPSGLLSAIGTPLFSLHDKFRVLGEPFRKPGNDPHETLAALVKRRLGTSFLEYAIDPFILGVYAGDPSQLVPKYALPKLYDLEQQYGSFIGGAMKKKKEPKSMLEQRATREIFSVKGGLQKLTDALHEGAGKQQFVLNAKEVQVWPTDNGFAVNYEKDGELLTLEAGNVITTTGAFTMERLLPFVEEDIMAKVANLHHTKVVEFQIGFKNWDGMKLDGFGGLIPFKEKRDILGVMFMSSIVEGRAPQKGALFAVFVGGVRRQDMFEKTDEEVTANVLTEFADLMGSDRKPDMVKLHRYHQAIPQYDAKSGERFAACDALEKQFPGLHIGGNLRDGIGMADRIKQAALIAKRLLAV